MKEIIKEHKKSVIKMLILTGVLSILRVLPSYLLSFATTAIFNKDLYTFLIWDVVIITLWIIFIFYNYFLSVYQEKNIQNICISLRRKEANKIKDLHPEVYNKFTADGYVSKLTNDISQIEVQGLSSLYNLFSNIWLVSFSTIALFLFNKWLVVVVLFLTSIILLIPHKLGNKLVELGNQLSKSNSEFVKQISNILRGYKVFRYGNKLNMIPKSITLYSNELSNSKVSIAKTQNKISSIIGFSSLLSQMIIDIFTGVLAILGRTTVGAISSSGNLAANIFNSVSASGELLIQLKSVEPIVESFYNENSEEVMLRDKTDLQSFSYLKLDNVSYSYDNTPVLKNINLVFEKGKKYLLTGKSGSGKSTLLKIIAGEINNYIGTITIDKNKVEDINVNTLVQYIDQDNYLFNASYKENITLWEEYSEEEINLALNRASVDFITNSDKRIENNGTNLSGGQKQRIALARSFIQNKSFILLDEGTSSLDKGNILMIENLLLDNPDLTVILVTHNLLEENREKFDKIINLDYL